MKIVMFFANWLANSLLVCLSVDIGFPMLTLLVCIRSSGVPHLQGFCGSLVL